MKKILLIVLSLLCFTSSFANEKWFNFGNVSPIGMNVGFMYVTGTNAKCEYVSFNKCTVSIDVHIYGVYVGYSGAPAEHERDVRVDKWNDTKASQFRFGYSLPVYDFIHVTPYVCLTNIETGTTDGYDWSIRNNHIHNEFKTENSFNGVGYGGMITFDFYKHLNLNVYGSSNGFGFSLGFFM